MSMPLTRHYSAAAVRALPDDGKRYETVHGELLVTPAPGGRHQPLLSDLHFILYSYLHAHGLKGVLASPADVSFDDGTLVQPDLFVADIAAFLRSGEWSDLGTPYLVVEVLSRSSVTADRITKRQLYQEQRIPAYWIVEIEHRQVEVWTPDGKFPVIERERVLWRHPALAADCTVDLVALFGAA